MNRAQSLSLGRRALAAAALLAAAAGSAGAQVPALDAVRVEGAQRIEESAIRAYMKIAPGDRPSAADLDVALKALFATGLFADVDIRRERNDLVVRVAENPIINRLAFEGNRRVSDEVLRDEVSLRPRVVFTRSKAQADVQRIMEIYRRSGRFTVTVEPRIVRLPQNRVDLIFEVGEGGLTEIRKISFVGNHAFDDSELRDVVQTKESAWYRFLSSADTYDPDQLTFDRELLRRHYLANGYADFRVVSAVAELTPDNEAFFVTFTVVEGERYKFGDVSLSTTFRDLDAGRLRGLVEIAPGDWYDAEKVEDAISVLTDAAGDQGYAFVEVVPEATRRRDERTVDLALAVREGPRVFVERVEIVGNERTVDEVIRREVLIVEGDAFNASRLRRSRLRIVDLGFFDKVEATNEPGSAPDKTVIRIAVSERATGSLSFGVGVATNAGLLGNIVVRERNLLGRAQDLRLHLRLGQKEQQIDLSFTEPWLMDRDLSGGFDLFSFERDLQDESGYDHEEVGFALRAGYRLSALLRQRLEYTLRLDEVRDVAAAASPAIREEEGEFLTSALGQTLIYRQRDDPFGPGSRYSLEMRNVLAGLGGDSKYLKNRWTGRASYPLAGDWTLGLRLSTGYVAGFGEDIRIVDRFFLGGASLRGFEPRGIGPRDPTRRSALGGSWFYSGTVGVTFPLGLPNELGVKGRFFSDAGSLGDCDGRCDRDTDTGSLRASAGVGLSWSTPVGPFRLDLARPLAKEDFDVTETLRFSIGTSF